MKTITIQDHTIKVADDAHAALATYLKSIRDHFGSDAEAAKDIELAALDLLKERMSASGRDEATKEDVTVLVSTLGDAEAISSDLETVSAPLGRKLYRDTENKWIGGVASGLAAYFAIPAWVVRIGFIAALIFPLPSVVPYLLLWFIVPPARTKADRLRMHGIPVSVASLGSSEDYARKRVITLAMLLALVVIFSVMAVGLLLAYAFLTAVFG